MGTGANDSTTSMYSGGGDVTIRGKTTAGGTSAGLYQYGGWLLNSGKGAIVLDGYSANFYGMNLVHPGNNSTGTGK